MYGKRTKRMVLSLRGTSYSIYFSGKNAVWREPEFYFTVPQASTAESGDESVPLYRYVQFRFSMAYLWCQGTCNYRHPAAPPRV